MSYILDALRRADAERQRGQAPGLQQVTHEALAPPPAARPAAAAWFIALLLVAAGAAAAWWWLQPRPAAPIVAGPVPTPVPTLPASAAAATAPAPAPPASALVPVAPAVPAAPVVRPASPPVAKASVAPAPAPTQASTPAPMAAKPAASVAAPSPVLASALPEPLRGAVLRLQVGGVVHSQERSQSFVMVGGQIAHEGDTLAPGIVLERIGPRSLLLRVAEQAVQLPL